MARLAIFCLKEAQNFSIIVDFVDCIILIRRRLIYFRLTKYSTKCIVISNTGHTFDLKF